MTFRHRWREWYRVHYDAFVLLSVLLLVIVLFGGVAWFVANEHCIEGTVACASRPVDTR
jgi:hypothetical protein